MMDKLLLRRSSSRCLRRFFYRSNHAISQNTIVFGSYFEKTNPLNFNWATKATSATLLDARLITTSASPTSDMNSMVEVTKTIASSSASGDENGDADQEPIAKDGGGCCGGKDKPKSPEQIEEEEILALQMYIRETHREAKYEEALQVCQVLIERCEKHFGVNHPATASSYNNAAVMYKMLGNYNEARTKYHEALRVYKTVVGADHSSYAASLNNLANLARAQVQYDETLTAVERLGLMESSIEYFKEALDIRTAELGEDHPHTVVSRSNLGGALAAQFLYHQQQLAATAGNNGSPGATKPSKLTRQQRDLAEHHLRAAFNLAIQNQSKRQSDQRGKSDNRRKMNNSNGLVGITSLSASAAAQNLAVFLKCAADQLVSHPTTATTSPNEDQTAPVEMYSEAQWLYEQALEVRRQQLGDAHHDTIATMSSLAELKVALGDDEGATQLRQEIMNIIEKASPGDEEHAGKAV